jgi:protein O-GlcNAc transferase
MLETNPINIQPAIDFFDQQRFDQAAQYLDSLGNLNTIQDPQFLHLRGHLAYKLGDLQRAQNYLQKAIQLNSYLPGPYIDLGRVYFAQGYLNDAFQNWGLAVMLNPKAIDAYIAAGSAHLQLNNFENALHHFERILELEPQKKDVQLAIGSVLTQMGDLAKAESYYQQYLQNKPNDVSFLIGLAQCYTVWGRTQEAKDVWQKALALDPENSYVSSPYLMSLLFSTDDRALLYQEHKRISEHTKKTVRVLPPRKTGDGEKIKVGYLSPNLNNHALRHFLEPILKNHDRKKIELFLYHDSTKEDDATARYRQYSDHWFESVKHPDEALAQKIYEDKIDVLINLAGYSDNDRARVFLMKPAPIQVSWMAYSCTTGMDTMDYRLVDEKMCPQEVDSFYTEKLIRLKKSVCFLPDRQSPAIESLPADRNGFFTFGCISQFRKINPQMLDLWCRILKQVPQTRMVMIVNNGKNFFPLLKSFFESRGVDSARVKILGEQKLEDYLAVCNQIDLMFDTFPMGGGVTAYQSLWMGTPMLALEGKAESSRMCSMILQSLGLQEFIACSPEEYMQKAVQFAKDFSLIRDWRKNARMRMIDDSKEYTLEFENALVAMVSEKIK